MRKPFSLVSITEFILATDKQCTSPFDEEAKVSWLAYCYKHRIYGEARIHVPTKLDLSSTSVLHHYRPAVHHCHTDMRQLCLPWNQRTVLFHGWSRCRSSRHYIPMWGQDWPRPRSELLVWCHSISCVPIQWWHMSSPKGKSFAVVTSISAIHTCLGLQAASNESELCK